MQLCGIQTRIGKHTTQSRREVARLQRKPVNEPAGVLVADEVLFIQREKCLDEKLLNASHTAGSDVDIVGVFSAVPQTEFGAPQALLDNPIFQRSRIHGYRFLQPGDFAVRIVEWNTNESLAKINEGEGSAF